MMWLCIEVAGRARLTLCEPRQNSQAYQDTILTPNLNFIKRRGGNRGRAPIVFQQDGATCHTSVSTRGFLARNGVQVLPEWPPNSPDLNPVEHCWAWIARRLIGQNFASAEALEAGVRRIWAQRPPDLLLRLFASMPSRCEAVIKAKGGHTKY